MIPNISQQTYHESQLVKNMVIIPPTYEVCLGLYNFCHVVRWSVRLFMHHSVHQLLRQSFALNFLIVHVSVTTFSSYLVYDISIASPLITAFHVLGSGPWVGPGVNNEDLGIFIMSKLCVKPFIIAHIYVNTYQILLRFRS